MKIPDILELMKEKHQLKRKDKSYYNRIKRKEKNRLEQIESARNVL
jgi:hypothetical protein